MINIKYNITNVSHNTLTIQLYLLFCNPIDYIYIYIYIHYTHSTSLSHTQTHLFVTNRQNKLFCQKTST